MRRNSSCWSLLTISSFYFRNVAKYERIALNRHAVELTGAHDVAEAMDVATILCEAQKPSAIGGLVINNILKTLDIK